MLSMLLGAGMLYIILAFLPGGQDHAWSLEEPEDPEEPTVADSQDREKKPAHKKKDHTPYKVRVTLADGRSVSGTVYIKYEKFSVKHKADGFVYTKQIRFSGLKYLKIMRWKPVAKQNSEKNMYYCIPDIYRLVTRDGVTVTIRRKFDIFHDFRLHNKNGETRCFAYFVDYWQGKSKKSGYWENARKRDFDYVRRHPPGRVVRKIEFYEDASGTSSGSGDSSDS